MLFLFAFSYFIQKFIRATLEVSIQFGLAGAKLIIFYDTHKKIIYFFSFFIIKNKKAHVNRNERFLFALSELLYNLKT